MTATIGNKEARRLFLRLHGLSEAPRTALNGDGLVNMIEQLGFVQIDSINTVERAHHQILFSRNQTYRQKQLAHVHHKRQDVFENWTHDAAIIPSVFYPYWKHHFARVRKKLRERWRKWRREGFEDLIDEIRDRIASDGPAMSRDFARSNTKKGDGWWDWHPEKTALEYLWRTGEIAVLRRDGFQKVYDLSERVIPQPHFHTEVSRQDFIDWACNAALDRLGFATTGEIAAFFDLVSPAEARHWAEAQGKDLVETAVECAGSEKARLCLARPDIIDIAVSTPPPPGRLRVLSPFDPVLRDRARTERLFGFRYRIEVFVPQAKREFGYYVFPLLERDRLVGRIDMKHNRSSGQLTVKALWLERKIRFSSGREQNLMSELSRVQRFTGAERLEFADGWQRGCG